MTDVLAKFGRAVRKRRLELQISQEDLAERTGLHRTYISDIERGNRNISLANIFKLLEGLETDAKGFFQKHY